MENKCCKVKEKKKNKREKGRPGMEREGEVEEKREVEKTRKSGRCPGCGRGRQQPRPV